MRHSSRGILPRGAKLLDPKCFEPVGEKHLGSNNLAPLGWIPLELCRIYNWTPALSKISGLGLKDNADRSHLARGTKPSATGPYWHSVTHLTFLSGERGDAVLLCCYVWSHRRDTVQVNTPRITCYTRDTALGFVWRWESSSKNR